MLKYRRLVTALVGMILWAVLDYIGGYPFSRDSCVLAGLMASWVAEPVFDRDEERRN